MSYKVEIRTRQNPLTGKFQPAIAVHVNKATSRGNLPGVFNSEKEAKQFAEEVRRTHVETRAGLSDRETADFICKSLCEIALAKKSKSIAEIKDRKLVSILEYSRITKTERRKLYRLIESGKLTRYRGLKNEPLLDPTEKPRT